MGTTWEASEVDQPLLFMDDLKLYPRSEEELESLINVVQGFSQDIGMEFFLDNGAVLVLIIEWAIGVVRYSAGIVDQSDWDG